MDIDSCHDAYRQHVGPATQQQDPAPDPSGISHNLLLNQLIERHHISESSLSRMAHEINELRQAVLSMANGGAIPPQGSNPSTVTVGQVADPGPSNLSPPPTASGMPGPSSLHARRFGPPGTFQKSVPPPVHRRDIMNQFNVSFPSVFNWRVCVD